MKFRNPIHLYISFIILMTLNCTKQKGIDGNEIQTHPMISAYTTGTISRTTPIRIQFLTDIVDSSRINTNVEPSPISFSPNLEGTTIWSNMRTLEFRPEKPIESGKVFDSVVKLSQFMEVEKGQETFSFRFATMQQSFEIFIDGLVAVDPSDIARQQITGMVRLADMEASEQVEKMVTAKQSGKTLTVQWQHDQTGREHRFIVKDIIREEESTTVDLSWTGSPIDVDDKGKRNIDVPGLDMFKVTQARAVRIEDQSIELLFSDPLEVGQNLQGLIHIEGHSNLRFSIQNNLVQIYSSQRWSGEVSLIVEDGVRNVAGNRLKERSTFQVYFEAIKPQVRFVGQGVILPTSQGLTVPFEAVNLNAVIVEAMRIYDQNMPQFLQVNTLEEDREIHRVGQTVWKEVVPLDTLSEHTDQWVRYGLDVGPLVENYPGGLYRLILTFRRQHIIYACAEGAKEEEIDLSFQNWDDNEGAEASNWDYYDSNFDWGDYYRNRMNPCHPAYYREYYDHNITVSQNITISNVGIIAKMGNNDTLVVAVTDIRTSEPLSNTILEVLDYQENVIATGSTDGKGVALIPVSQKPFLLIAQNGDDRGYLKLNDGSALSISHFDVGGNTTEKGIKGFIYGERGVWRPGDPIYLTFILMDDGHLPPNHPVSCELRNPRGQLIKTITQTKSMNSFYLFQMSTEADAPTGSWLVRVRVGGATFEKSLKIETVMPNRLKINLDFGEKDQLTEGTVNIGLSSTWLHGAIARELEADMQLSLSPVPTHFDAFSEYVFDDPVRQYEPESKMVFEGSLDSQGKTSVQVTLPSEVRSPGMLSAEFTTHVFEPGGAFSTDYMSIPFHPYNQYVGIHIPQGDKARGMLLTDTTHTVRIVKVDTQGNLQGNGSAEVTLYKIKWRWWWEKGDESLSDYVGQSSYGAIQCDTVRIVNGKGEWPLRVEYPQWGRYLIRVRDLLGNHITGQIAYIDWPGWAGRGQKDQPGGATVLTFSSDKQEYQVGEQVVVTLPIGNEGRALVSIESGTRILKVDWIEGSGEPVQYKFKVTPEMAPNVYVHVTFIQPHLQVENDLPIRMYGVIPIKVFDPTTKLTPLIETPDVFVPESTAKITVSEAQGMSMTYTLAIVDEGLLDLTRFQTPNPWDYFYMRQALGVKTWDLYEWVAGAFGGSLERLLAIGGGEEGMKPTQQKANRFPPMVRFYGPFELNTNGRQTHNVDIPQYVGSVRVMVVAGHDRAFGVVDKAVFVRKPLMVLGTLPRVLSIQEEVSLPISVFALEEKIRDVTVSLDVEGSISLVGNTGQMLHFSEIGDKIVTFHIKALDQQGVAVVKIRAVSGDEQAAQNIELDVRNPVGKVIDVVDDVLEVGKTWRSNIDLPGVAGTNVVILEVSSMPPLNLGKRLGFLISYPHGCVEQTISSVFPQLYLNHLLDLSTDKKQNIETNIKAGIERLRMFQRFDGGFGYWPGTGESHDWCSNYAGHFLLEARNAGYNIPADMLDPWVEYQIRKAQSWTTGPERSSLIQAYRLFTLALAGRPELGAMNRLKEKNDLSTTERWQLAAAYQLTGQPEAAQSLIRENIQVLQYLELGNTYGSDLRDKAIILEALSLMNDLRRARSLVLEISEALSDDKWLSTQTTAFALIALAKYTGIAGRSQTMGFEFVWNDQEKIKVSTDYPIAQRNITVNEDTTGVIVVENRSQMVLYPRLIIEGHPRMGRETVAQNGMKIEVSYMGMNNESLNVIELSQGTNIVTEIKVTHTGTMGNYEEVVLSHLVPSGWEIYNERLGQESDSESSIFEYQDIRDDRVYTYFDLKQGESKTFRMILNASYLGQFYLPPISVEAMYNETINARTQGQWIRVVQPN